MVGGFASYIIAKHGRWSERGGERVVVETFAGQSVSMWSMSVDEVPWMRVGVVMMVFRSCC